MLTRGIPLMALIIFSGKDLIETLFKSWDEIEIFSTAGIKLKLLNKSGYYSTN